MSGTAYDQTIFALELQVRAMAADWERAADRQAEAEAALAAVVDDPDADEAARNDAETREELARAEADRLGEAVDKLARRICATPAETLAGLACKARIALWLEIDGLADLVLRDVVRLADVNHG